MIDQVNGIIENVSIEINISTQKSNRVFSGPSNDIRDIVTEAESDQSHISVLQTSCEAKWYFK